VTGNDLYMLLPLIIICTMPVLMMLLIVIRRLHFLTMMISLLGFALAFAALLLVSADTPHVLEPLFNIDSFSIFYMELLFGASFLIVLLSYRYLLQIDGNREEYYILLFLATLGSAVLVISRHFVSMFLGLEILSISLYSLIAYLPLRENSTEAGIKYLILAAASSAIMLFGMALVYAATGMLDFSALAVKVTDTMVDRLLVTGGFALMLVGIGFKLAVVPFHMWSPDVYQGAPAPVTAFIATVSKGGVIAVLLRVFLMSDGWRLGPIVLIFTIIAVASMFTGNWLALMQTNVKRILAYSSIAHLGYLFVAILASGRLAIEAASFYLVSYFITLIGAFAVITVLSTAEREPDAVEDFRGFYWRHPWLAAIFTAMLFSLAGIPLTAGFIGKFYVLIAGVNGSLWLLVVTLVINSIIGIFYYLRIIVFMYSRPENETRTTTSHPPISFSGGLALAMVTLLLIWFGIYPFHLMELIRAMTRLMIIY
jgi:NADH-quinone oxidoreductase subunit N